jgi:hypothetical protein
LKQHFQDNHRMNDLVHSRVIIRDNEEALVSSADLTQDSLLTQFKAGVLTTDATMIRSLQRRDIHQEQQKCRIH